jgi:hypothetical protein
MPQVRFFEPGSWGFLLTRFLIRQTDCEYVLTLVDLLKISTAPRFGKTRLEVYPVP